MKQISQEKLFHTVSFFLLVLRKRKNQHYNYYLINSLHWRQKHWSLYEREREFFFPTPAVKLSGANSKQGYIFYSKTEFFLGQTFYGWVLYFMSNLNHFQIRWYSLHSLSGNVCIDKWQEDISLALTHTQTHAKSFF